MEDPILLVPSEEEHKPLVGNNHTIREEENEETTNKEDCSHLEINDSQEKFDLLQMERSREEPETIQEAVEEDEVVQESSEILEIDHPVGETLDQQEDGKEEEKRVEYEEE